MRAPEILYVINTFNQPTRLKVVQLFDKEVLCARKRDIILYQWQKAAKGGKKIDIKINIQGQNNQFFSKITNIYPPFFGEFLVSSS